MRHSDVQSWITDLTARHGATTVLRAYGVLAAILDDAVHDKRLLSNPTWDMNLPRKTKGSHTCPTHDHVGDLAREAGDKATLVIVLADCGLRWGEAVGLRVKDLDNVAAPLDEGLTRSNVAQLWTTEPVQKDLR